jgi:hypothetical protein
MVELAKQLQDIETVLAKLKDLVDRESKAGRSLDLWPTLLSLNNPGGAFEQCKIALTALSAEISTKHWQERSIKTRLGNGSPTVKNINCGRKSQTRSFGYMVFLGVGRQFSGEIFLSVPASLCTET